jgi:hypothetical protein
MRPAIELLLILALLISIAFLVTRGISEVRAQREELEAKISELLGREEVTLADFIEALGEPRSISVVTCEGTKCIKAAWDLSYATRECWKRLVVILNEEEKRIFYSEMQDLTVISREDGEARCIEAPN